MVYRIKVGDRWLVHIPDEGPIIMGERHEAVWWPAHERRNAELAARILSSLPSFEGKDVDLMLGEW